MWAFEEALAAQTSVWGGVGNIPLPYYNGVEREDLFWALLDVQDPDVVLVHATTNATLELAAPDAWTAGIDELNAQLPEGTSPDDAEAHFERWSQLGTVPHTTPDDFQAQLVRAINPFSLNGVTLNTSSSILSDPDVTFLDLTKLPADALPAHVVDRGTNSGPLHRLFLTASSGRLPPRVVEALRDATKSVRQLEANAQDWAEVCVPGPNWRPLLSGPVHPWALSLHGAARYVHRAAARVHDLIVVSGEDQWDFALYVALSRWRDQVFWAPQSLIDDDPFRTSLARGLRGGRDFAFSGAHGQVLVTGASNEETAQRVEAVQGLVGSDRSVTWADWPDVIPTRPARLLYRDTHFHSLPLVVKDGQTPALSTPIPRSVESSFPPDTRWITDLVVDDWTPIRHTALADLLFEGGFINSFNARAGREAVSYRCPGDGFIGPDLDVATVRPRVRFVGLEQQVEAIGTRQGLTTTVSDKGSYARESSRLLGGWDALVATLQDNDVRQLLAAFRAEKDEPAPGLFLVDDRRRYVNLDDLPSERFTRPPDEIVAELEAREVLVRGMVLKCESCRATRWHGLDQVDTHFRCGRCGQRQRLESGRWLGTAEPTWYLRLAEVVYQLLTNNGDLPLLALASAFQKDAQPIDQMFETEISGWSTESPIETSIEVDIIASEGYRLWIGEATTRNRFGEGAAEHRRFERLAAVAGAFDAWGVLLCTSQPTFSDATVDRARQLLRRRGQEPRFVTRVSLASAARWQPS